MTADRAASLALQALAAGLDDLHLPAMLIGGMAVIARGVPRTTLDIDATVWGEGLDVEQVVSILRTHGIVPRIHAAESFARQHSVLLLRHQPSGTPIDLTLAWLPFEREALARATRVDLGGISVPVALPEDLVVYRDMDIERVRALVAEFASALDSPERVAEIDALLDRVTRPQRS